MCSVPECLNVTWARGLCNSHYKRFRRYGDPLGGGAYRGRASRYFWEHVDDDTDSCIVWPQRAGDDYGQIWINGKVLSAHVVACERRYGPMPAPGMVVTHLPVICHNRGCFNWRHLRWATQKQNIADKVLDGTVSTGTRNGRAILTEEQVIEIRTRYAAGGISRRLLGIEYGVSGVTIKHIVVGDTWKTVPISGSAPQQKGTIE
jgi:hypothetical protein